jgi:cyclic beta-1,2-glucan synthetase
MYRAGLEYILGMEQRGNKLRFEPCIPQEWDGFKVFHQFGTTKYEIEIENPNHVTKGIQRVELDSVVHMTNTAIEMKDDQQQHRVRIVMGGL